MDPITAEDLRTRLCSHTLLGRQALLRQRWSGADPTIAAATNTCTVGMLLQSTGGA